MEEEIEIENLFILKYYFQYRTDPTKLAPLRHLASSPATLSQLTNQLFVPLSC